MSFIKTTTIIFVLHLVVVLAFGALVAMSYDPRPYPIGINEAQLIWLAFYVIDFPLGLLLYPIAGLLVELFPILSSSFDNYYWDCVVLPALLVQMLGWMNWTMIWYACKYLCKELLSLFTPCSTPEK